MLKDTTQSITDGSIFCYRSNLGEEVITKLVSQDEESYMVSIPLRLYIDQTGQPSFIPAFVMAGNKPIKILKKEISATYLPSAEYEDAYITNTSSIQLPPSKSLIV